MAELRIRPAAPGDAAAIAALKVAAWRAAYAGLLPAAQLATLDEAVEAAEWRAYLETRPAAERLWLADDAGGLAGFARAGPARDGDLDPGAGEVYGLYAAPERIGTGVGRALLAHALADLHERGFESAVVWELAGNERAAAFYERAGLALDGVRRRSRFGVEELRRRTALA